MAKPENLIVKIRCVHQKYGDFNTEVNLDWLVQDLKAHLGDVYPSKPDPSMQRLVYAGQLMKENEKIVTYLKRLPEIELPIVHLVYTPNVIDPQPSPKKLSATKPTTISQAESELRRRKPVSASPNAENSQNLVPNFDPSDGGNAQAASSPPNFGAFGPTNQFYPSNFNQLAAGYLQPHQMNMNPYMNQYFQYLQQLYGPVYWPYGLNSPPVGATGANFMSFTVPQMFPGTNYASGVPPADVAPPVGPQAAPQNLVQQAPQRDLAMNAQGGVADDDEGRNRDWLDHVYTAARAALLFIILYSYSSMERLSFVVTCCALLYAFQAGWFTRRRAPAVPGAAQPQGNPQVNQNPANPADAQAPANENQAAPNSDTPNDQATNQNSTVVNGNEPTNQNPPAPQTAWNVFWSTCYVFISSFFASLIPERPPPVNIN